MQSQLTSGRISTKHKFHPRTSPVALGCQVQVSEVRLCSWLAQDSWWDFLLYFLPTPGLAHRKWCPVVRQSKWKYGLTLELIFDLNKKYKKRYVRLENHQDKTAKWNKKPLNSLTNYRLFQFGLKKDIIGKNRQPNGRNFHWVTQILYRPKLFLLSTTNYHL